MKKKNIEIIQFSNKTRNDRRLMKRFVNFHWELYRNEPRFIPLLNYEFLGFKLLGLTGWFEPSHHFFKYGEMTFFLALENGRIVGRTCAFVNRNHNKYYNDKVGFFGFFESLNNQTIADALLDEAVKYLKYNGMTEIRGPQNLPVNEATPGTLVDGFNAPPYVYYHFNYPYYATLFKNYGMNVIKKVVGVEIPIQDPIEDRLLSLSQKAKSLYNITFEPFTRKRYRVLRQYVFDIYNEAWKDNWGFVPFEKEEFFKNLDDMRLIWDPKMFLIAYVKGEPAAFLGSVPNIFEKLKPLPIFRRVELLRAAKMLLTKGSIKSFRLGYFGIRPKYRKIGLDAILTSEGKHYIHRKNYRSCDMGWILEDNKLVLRMGKFLRGEVSRTYAIFQKYIGSN